MWVLSPPKISWLSPEGWLKLWLWVFILSWLFLTTSYDTTFAFDHPIYSAVLACDVGAVILLSLAVSDPNRNSYSPKPVFLTVTDDLRSLVGLLRPSPVGHINWIRIARLPGQKVLAMYACILCVRVELFRQITVHSQCASTGYTCAIPFLISLRDYFRKQRHQPAGDSLPLVESTSAPRRVLRLSYQRFHHGLPHSRQWYLISTALLAFGGLLVSSFDNGRASTYICPLVSGNYWRIPLFRAISVLLDTALVIGIANTYNEWVQSSEQERRVIARQWGKLLLGVALFWTLLTIITSIFNVQGGITFRIRGYYVQSIVGQGFLVLVLFFSALQLIPRYGILALSMLAGLIALYLSSVSALFKGRKPFPLISSSDAIAAYVAMFIGAVLFLYAWSVSEAEPKPRPPSVIVRLLLTLLFGVGLFLAVSQADVVKTHPIDRLIFKAIDQNTRYLAQAQTSRSLEEAVVEYQRRYNLPPPPGFDKWYEYATSRESPVIDDFDQIHTNLLRFRAFTPQRLRDLTHQMATHPADNIGNVSIRNGTPTAQEGGIIATHVWMIRAIADMMRNFACHLPDMDIAFNLDDQPRIAAPWETVSAAIDEVRSQPPQDLVLDTWTKDRASRWKPIQQKSKRNSFSNNDGLRNFDKYVRDLCPPYSTARTNRVWDRHGICLTCIPPHSSGQFPSDWDLAKDICHQPDVAELHGFFSGPTAFVPSRELLPVFSQSSISGFSDILYPSPWNYVDKENIKYNPTKKHPDPEYDQKDNTLFWIGSTSEGMGSKERWQGLGRQRFLHLVNNNTKNKVSVLLPTSSNPNTYSYQILDGSAPTEDLGLDADVHFNATIRCGECDTQNQELGTTDKVKFQSHWQYRHLFDLDGAGFSGRFLPFLQSRSLPFKTGLFRHWFDSLLTPWLHYVPVDLRLHGVWSTLAYFAGVNGTVSGGRAGIFGGLGPSRRVVMQAHDAEGRRIAEEGRQWAQRAIRKEDMEIYFFRLLLEWGRLTGDHRDVLGFTME